MFMSLVNAGVIKLSVGQEKIILRARTGRFGSLLERESRSTHGRRGEVRFTQVVLVNEKNVKDFIESEPYPEVQSVVPQLVGDAIASDAPQSAPMSDGDPFEMIRKLAGAPDEAVLADRMTTVVQHLGAGTCFFFLTERGDNGDHRSYRVLAGSHADFVQKYVERKWYATDPFLTHATHSQNPFFSSDVGLIGNLWGSRREMGEFGRRLGASSWIAMPVHGPEGRFFGALYVANSILPSAGGEEPLRNNRLLFKLIAGEVFDWYERQERDFSLKSSGLTTFELDILDSSARGETAEQIAASLNLTPNAVTRRYFRSINSKLKTRTITEAVRLARIRGLLALASSRKVGYVLHSSRYGIFLRCELGAPFWSGVIPAGIDEAQVFADVESAQKGMDALMLPTGHDCELRRVEVHHTATTATINDCVVSGLPPWNPSMNTNGGPADDSGTPGTLEGPPPSSYH